MARHPLHPNRRPERSAREDEDRRVDAGFRSGERNLSLARTKRLTYAAACLAGEAGLRIGEIRALKWREDVDLPNRYLTISRQAGNGFEGTPKGRTRRTVPMTSTLVAALEALPVDKDARDLKGRPVRDGYVLHNEDKGDPENETGKNTPLHDAQTSHAVYRFCDRAELEDRGWHTPFVWNSCGAVRREPLAGS